jgi:hypothetical protein
MCRKVVCETYSCNSRNVVISVWNRNVRLRVGFGGWYVWFMMTPKQFQARSSTVLGESAVLENWIKIAKGFAVAQVVRCRPLTVEALVRTRVSLCGIYDGQSDTVTSSALSSSVSHCQYQSAVALHSHISSGEWAIWPLVIIEISVFPSLP